MRLRTATTALMFCAAALSMPTALSAQFTSFVAPPRKASTDSTKPTVAVAKARADSVARMTLTDMKKWVDSAAGVPTTQVASANDTSTIAATTPTEQREATGRTTTTFSNGALAPNTASALPLYLLAGLTSLVIGLLLFRLRPRRA